MTAPLNYSTLRAPDLSLADHVGKLLATAKGDKLALAQRIYSTLNPTAMARANFVASMATCDVHNVFDIRTMAGDI